MSHKLSLPGVREAKRKSCLQTKNHTCNDRDQTRWDAWGGALPPPPCANNLLSVWSIRCDTSWKTHPRKSTGMTKKKKKLRGAGSFTSLTTAETLCRVSRCDSGRKVQFGFIAATFWCLFHLILCHLSLKIATFDCRRLKKKNHIPKEAYILI